MAPEQLDGDSIDLRADLFAFGIILYEITTGRHPFAGKTPNSTIGNILKEELQRISQLVPKAPARLQAVIHKCLRKDRNERYQSVSEVLVDVETAQSQLTDSGKRFVASPDADISMSKSTAWGLFLLIQIGYIALYAAVLYWIDPVH